MNILVLNCGSSSVKFQVIDTDLDLIESDSDRQLAIGEAERIGGHGLLVFQATGKKPVHLDAPLRDHRAAIDMIMRWVISPDSGIDQIQSMSDIHAVGHRVVHGGEKFKASVRIDPEVFFGIEDCIDLAPLHNPANLKGITAAENLLGTGVPQVAVFDTSFHTTMPEVSYLYGIPYAHYRRHKIRRYGFHGTSHRYVSYRYRMLLGLERDDVNIITLHLGNGCSACAIKNGESFDTSMGFTPMEGLLMATRAGDVDASILDYLSHKEGLSLQELDTMLNKQSGMLGISGITGDMRDLLAEVEENQDRRARLAIEIFCYRVRKYIGAYLAVLEKTDAVVFTGGIGENSVEIRERICAGLGNVGIYLDTAKNGTMVDGKLGEISALESSTKVYVIPTNEELLIARDAYRVVTNAPRRW